MTNIGAVLAMAPRMGGKRRVGHEPAEARHGERAEHDKERLEEAVARHQQPRRADPTDAEDRERQQDGEPLGDARPGGGADGIAGLAHLNSPASGSEAANSTAPTVLSSRTAPPPGPNSQRPSRMAKGVSMKIAMASGTRRLIGASGGEQQRGAGEGRDAGHGAISCRLSDGGCRARPRPRWRA
jgi:hypothetical protein